MKYSISHKDEAGVTRRSEWLAFDSDTLALSYTEESATADSLTEVWKGEQLLARFEKGVAENGSSIPAATAA